MNSYVYGDACAACPGSLLCITGEVDYIQKCSECSRAEATWPGHSDGGNWYFGGRLYVPSACPRVEVDPIGYAHVADPSCSECGDRY